MGWILVGLLAWLLILGLSPAMLYRVAPARLRTNSPWGVGGLPLLAVMVAGPVVVMAWWGSALPTGEPNTSGLVVPVLIGILLGGPASAVSMRAWRTQHAKVLNAAPSADLGLFSPGVPARSAARPSTLAQIPPLLETRVRTNRLMRRSRTLLLATAGCLYVLARLLQADRAVRHPGQSDEPGLVLVLAVACVIAAGVLTLVLRARQRRRGKGSSIGAMALEHGWRFGRSDAGQLAARFPQLPFLRSTGASDVVSPKCVVWGTAVDRRWWAVDQAGTRGNARGVQRSARQWVVVVSLPGAALPPVVVAGRDLVGVRDWLGRSMQLELHQWNSRMWVSFPPEVAPYAHAVLHPRAMEHLLAALPDGTLLIVAGDALAVWRDGPLIAPDLEAALHCALGMADLLPEFILNDHASRAGGW